MRFLGRLKSMHANVILWIILPLSLVLIGIILNSAFIYQNIVTRLVLDRHRHLANVAAVSVSQEIDNYTQLLKALGSSQDIRNASTEIRANALVEAPPALDVFTAGVMIVDLDGNVVHATSDLLNSDGSAILQSGFPSTIKEMESPAFSNVISVPSTGKKLVLVSTLLYDAQGSVTGAIVGGLDLATAPFNRSVQKLSEPSEGYVYIVDHHGIVISHPNIAEIGNDFQDRPSMQNGPGGENTEVLWVDQAGDRFIMASAPVSVSGWKLIVKEPWEAVISSARFYSIVILMISLLAVLFVTLLAWQGTKKVTTPIQKLVQQTIKLSHGDSIEPFEQSNIYEIDRLGESFENMAHQIDDYRNGLRQYVGAITSAQEEERLRIARELHDEIIQNLLTISRKIELCQYTGDEQEQEQLLAQLKDMTNHTMQEVRQISQDLRPMMLEDLGLVPAIRMLVQTVHQGDGAIPHATFQVNTSTESLNAEQELVIYRIIQEALTNVQKHACATGVVVDLRFHDNEVHLVVHDDGKGFIVPATMIELVQQGRLGLVGIQERVWAVKGNLSIDSRPGHGTKMDITIPLDQPNH